MKRALRAVVAVAYTAAFCLAIAAPLPCAAASAAAIAAPTWLIPPVSSSPTGGTLSLATCDEIAIDRGASDAVLREAERFAAELATINGTPPTLVALQASPRDRATITLELHCGTDDVTGSPTATLTSAIAPTSLANDHDAADASQVTITDSEVAITAADATALFRATRSLLHAATYGDAAAIPTGTYSFSWVSERRSIHLDVARKHYPPATLRQFIREAAWAGFNEFELHVSENEGFAIESESHPQIVSPDALTKAQVRELIEFAADLHVNITPSLDAPGHLDYVLDSYPQFRLRSGSGEETFGGLDITNPEAVRLVDDLIDEYAELFPKSVWNLGADEFVDFDDADEVAVLTEYARQRFGPDATAYDALTEFVNDRAARLRTHGFTTRVWSDGMLQGEQVRLDRRVEVAYWTTRPAGVASVDDVAAAGNPLLNVNDEYLYFVLGERVGYSYPDAARLYRDWSPQVFPSLAGAAQRPNASATVRGGMFAIWSDIPEALTPQEVLDLARPALRAMAARLAVPDASLPWSALEPAAASTQTAPDEAALSPDWRTFPPAPSPSAASETALLSSATLGHIAVWGLLALVIGASAIVLVRRTVQG